MMQGRFEEAVPLLKKSFEGGCIQAGENLQTIEAEYAYEAQQRLIIEEYLKKFE